MKNDPKPDPASAREREIQMCNMIIRLYELQRDFIQVAEPDSDSLECFDNGIFDCVTACTGAIAERLKHEVLKV